MARGADALEDTPAEIVATMGRRIQTALLGYAAALLNVGKSLANLLAEDGVLLNSIAPGPVDTDAWGRAVAQAAERSGITVDEARADLELRESIKIPLGRIGDPTDVPGCAVFLASKQAAWITGACFHIDGGKLMGIG